MLHFRKRRDSEASYPGSSIQSEASASEDSGSDSASGSSMGPGDSDAFKAQIQDSDDKLLVAEEIKAIVLSYLGGQDVFELPAKLQEEEYFLYVCCSRCK